jgi:hypothetical protein
MPGNGRLPDRAAAAYPPRPSRRTEVAESARNLTRWVIRQGRLLEYRVAADMWRIEPAAVATPYRRPEPDPDPDPDPARDPTAAQCAQTLSLLARLLMPLMLWLELIVISTRDDYPGG